MNRQTLVLALASIGAVTLLALKSDDNFLSKASQANLAEIAAGKLAISKGSSSKVKTFAKQMVADHTTAQTELVKLAKKQGVTIPMEPDADHKAMKEQLTSMSGASFDSAYMASQLTDHQTAVALFTDESSNGTDQASKAYAAKYLPKLQGHLNMVSSSASGSTGSMSKDMKMDSVK